MTPFRIYHTYACHIMDWNADPFAVARGLIEAGMYNGLIFWPCHHKKPVALPPAASWTGSPSGWNDRISVSRERSFRRKAA